MPARGAICQASINASELRTFRTLLPLLKGWDNFEKRCRDVVTLVALQSVPTEKAWATLDVLLAKAFSDRG